MPKYIDADALYDTLCALWDKSDSEEFEQGVFKIIQKAPAIDRWIPCSERLPNSQETVLVSVRDETGDTRYDYASHGWLTRDKEYWIVDDEINNYVVAWMPLPEPYTGEETTING